MVRELKIDRAIYLADDRSRTYRFLKRNPEWKKLGREENEQNKKSLHGYVRLLRNRKTKTYIFKSKK